MKERKLRLLHAAPGPATIRAIVADFSKRDEGTITSFVDTVLQVVRQFVDPDEVEVVPFGMLVRRALDWSGEAWLPLATRGQHEAALVEAGNALESDSALVRSTKFPGSRRAIAETLDEIHQWSINLPQLAAQLENEDPDLSVRLATLQELDQKSQDILAKIARELPSKQLLASVHAIAEPEAIVSRLLVFIGSEPTLAKLKWLDWIADQGCDVTVVAERHTGHAALFQPISRLERILKVKAIQVGSGNRLLNNLFADLPSPGTDVEVQIQSASDPLSESEWAIRTCMAARESGSAAIFVRSLAEYGPLLEASAERFSCPLRIHRRIGLMENAFVRMTLTVLNALALNDVRLFRSVFGSSYLALSKEQRTHLAAVLTRARSFRQAQWETLGSEIAGLGESFDWLGKILHWREESRSEEITLAEWVDKLVGLVNELPWYGATSKKDGPVAEGYDFERDGRAFTVMQSSLANEAAIRRAVGDLKLNFRGFVELCRWTWEAADVSVPSGDGLLVCSQAESLIAVDTLIVLGTIEGSFPRRRTQDPVLADDDRRTIRNLAKSEIPFPTSFERAEEEREEFYRLCAAANKRLVFSYPVAGAEQDNQVAFYAQLAATASRSDQNPVTKPIDRTAESLAPLKASDLIGPDVLIREALDGPKEPSPTAEIESAFVKRRLSKSREEGFLPQELRDMVECPFRYQMRYRLDVVARTRLSNWSRLRRLPIKGELAMAEDEGDARRRLMEALERELDRLYATIPSWELQVLRSGGQRLIREWIAREFKARQIWPRSQSPTIEPRFGSEGVAEVMPGGTKLKGSVGARSQLSTGTPVLTLYESRGTADKKLDPAEKLFYGLHLLAGRHEGKDAALELEGTAGKRTLMVVSRAGVGPIESNSKDGLHVLDVGEADTDYNSKRKFFGEVKEILKETIEKIESGEIRPTPGEHCTFCDYGELCRQSALFGDLEAVAAEDDDFEPI